MTNYKTPDSVQDTFLHSSVLALTLALATTTASAAEFIPFGFSHQNHNQAQGVSDDGTIVAGSFRPTRTSSDWEPFRWTEETGFAGLAGLPGLPYGFASSRQPLSADGSTLVGYVAEEARELTNNSRAFIHTQADGMRNLGANNNGKAIAVSSDGSVIVGDSDSFSQPTAWRWTAAGGVQPLGVLLDAQWSAATDVSDDGNIVVGLSGPGILSNDVVEVYRWTAETGMAGTGIFTKGNAEIEITVANNGMIAGELRDDENLRHAFIWTEETGVVELGYLPGVEGEGRQSAVRDMTPDGRLVVGWSGVLPDSIPFVWTAEAGMQDFQQVLKEQHGLTEALEGWELSSIQSVSANGQYFTGYSTRSQSPSGDDTSWLIRLDRPWGTPVPEPSALVISILSLGLLAVGTSRTTSVVCRGW